jgi:hypothetical protein
VSMRIEHGRNEMGRLEEDDFVPRTRKPRHPSLATIRVSQE